MSLQVNVRQLRAKRFITQQDTGQTFTIAGVLRDKTFSQAQSFIIFSSLKANCQQGNQMRHF